MENQWEGSTVDVKTAFLNAENDMEKEETILMVKPPPFLVEKQLVDRHTLFMPAKALYSPKELAWSFLIRVLWRSALYAGGEGATDTLHHIDHFWRKQRDRLTIPDINHAFGACKPVREGMCGRCPLMKIAEFLGYDMEIPKPGASAANRPAPECPISLQPIHADLVFFPCIHGPFHRGCARRALIANGPRCPVYRNLGFFVFSDEMSSICLFGRAKKGLILVGKPFVIYVYHRLGSMCDPTLGEKNCATGLMISRV